MTDFKWLGPRTVTRYRGKGSPGAEIETGHHYKVDDFGADVVAEWVRSGHAEYVDISKAKATTLDVQSVVVKNNVPKITGK